MWAILTSCPAVAITLAIWIWLIWANVPDKPKETLYEALRRAGKRKGRRS